jgi:glycosyltransferase involved in cell wall biosynthesis
VPRGDVDALAGAITRLASNADFRAELGAAAQRRAADFDWSTLADRYLECFRLGVEAQTGPTV